MKIIDRDTAEHYNWGNHCDGWRLVNHNELSVISERVPPGEREIRHHHTKTLQFFYILNGEAVVEINGTPVTLSSGQGVEIPPGVPHQFINNSDGDVDFLVISQPDSREDRTEG